MIGISCCSCVWNRTFAGFIGEEASLETSQDSSAHAAAKCSLPVKCISENDVENMRHIRDVVNHDAKRNNDVKACHEGNHPFSDAGNTSHAAADDSHGKNCNNSSDDHTVSTKCMVQRKGNSIGLDGVVNHAVSNGNEDGKDSCPEFVA